MRIMHRISGFTLIEVLGVLVIMGIVIAIAYPSFTQTVDTMEEMTIQADVTRLEAAIRLYYLDTQTYPGQLSDLWQAPDGTAGWQGPYLNPHSLSISAEDYRLGNLGRVYPQN